MSEIERTTGAARHPSIRSLRGLDALNFFLADVRDGLGPYLAIYLIAVRGPSQGWNEATTGLGGFALDLVTMPETRSSESTASAADACAA